MKKIPTQSNAKHILWFKDISIGDVSLVGGKNASLGEMYRTLSKKEYISQMGLLLPLMRIGHFYMRRVLIKQLNS